MRQPPLRHTAWCMLFWASMTHTGPTLPLSRLLQSLGPSRGCCCWVHRLETLCSLSLLASYVNHPRQVDKAHHGSGIICSLCRQISKHVDMLICFDPQAQEERCLHHANGFMASSKHAAFCTDVVRCSLSRWWRIIICMLLQIAGYFVQGLICLVYMPLCFQLARFTAEAASRVYCDLAQDIAAAQVPDIANANVPAVTRMFYSLPVRK